MTAKIDIITEGYARLVSLNDRGGRFMEATGSCCLVRSGRVNILFDTMGPWEKSLLIERLAGLNIHPDDIDLLVCSHSHPDHIGNLNLFTNADKHFIGTSVYKTDKYDLNCFEPMGSYEFITKRENKIEVVRYKSYDITNNIRIEPTHGHTLECVSMMINHCDGLGSVGLVGDLFECKEDVEDEGLWLGAGSQNPDLQRANRTRIYNEVDYILPGHGPLFRTSQSKPIRF